MAKTPKAAALVPIFQTVIGNDQVNAVDARTLHERLGSKKDFSNWIKKRVKDCNLLEGQDFLCSPNWASKNGGRGGYNKKDYWLTLDAAKHLAMIEKNAQGFKIRQYFTPNRKAIGLKRTVKIEFQGLMGEITYTQDAPQDFNVIFPDESKRIEIERYLTSERKFYIPESDRIDDYREDVARPTDNGTYFELALSSMFGKTGVLVH